jgi:ankyrin repeat protein
MYKNKTRKRVSTPHNSTPHKYKRCKRGGGTMKGIDKIKKFFNKDDGLLKICSSSKYFKFLEKSITSKTEIALQLIETKGLEEEGYLAQINENKDTALLLACRNKMTEVALKLTDFREDQVIPGQKNKDKDTALIWAFRNQMDEVVIKLIRNFGDQVNPGQRTKYGETALIYACRYNMAEVALKLITEFGEDKLKPEHICSGYTALLWACRNDMDEVALTLITKFGDKVKPGHINNDDGFTALQWACCSKKMTNVALTLITEFGDQVKPGHINDDGYTALIYACRHKMTEVALLLITEFGDQVNPGHINVNGKTALSWAFCNKMTDVMLELFKLYKPSDSEFKYIIKNIDRITGADKKKQILDNLGKIKMLEVKEVTLELPPNYIIEDIIEYEKYNIDDLKKILEELKDENNIEEPVEDPVTHIIYSVGTLGNNKDYRIINVNVSTLNDLKENNYEQGLGIITGHTIHKSLLEFIKKQPYNIYLLDFDDETIKPYILKKIVGFS